MLSAIFGLAPVASLPRRSPSFFIRRRNQNLMLSFNSNRHHVGYTHGMT